MPALRPLLAPGLLVFVGSLAAAQRPAPIVRPVMDVGSKWIGGIAEPRSGRFLVYANTESLYVVHHASGRRTGHAINVRWNDNNALTITRAGDKLVFLREDDARKGPFVWLLELDTLTGAPRGAPRRITTQRSRDPQPSPDGQRLAYVIDDFGHNLVGGGTRLAVIPIEGGLDVVLDSAARGIGNPRWSPDGQWIYYEQRPVLKRVRAAGGRPDSIGTTGRFVDLSPDGRVLASYSGPRAWNVGAHTLDLLAPDGRLLARTRSNVWDNRAYAWSGRGDRLYAVWSMEPETMHFASLADGKVTAAPFTERDVQDMRYSPDGRRVVVQTPSQLVVYDVARGTRRAFPPRDADGRSNVTWAPDGRRLAYVEEHADADGDGANQLRVLDVVTGRDVLVAALGNQSSYRWSSDGRAVLFVDRPRAMLGERIPIVRVGLDGTRRVLHHVTGRRRTRLAVLNDTLLVEANLDSGMIAHSLRTGRTTVLYRGTEPGNGMIASPDGAWIAMTVGTRDEQQIALVRADGTGFRKLGSTMCGITATRWMPGDREILAGTWDCNADRATRHIVALDGSPARLINLERFDSAVPTPDFKAILYTRPGTPTTRITALDVGHLLRRTTTSR